MNDDDTLVSISVVWWVFEKAINCPDVVLLSAQYFDDILNIVWMK